MINYISHFVEYLPLTSICVVTVFSMLEEFFSEK